MANLEQVRAWCEKGRPDSSGRLVFAWTAVAVFAAVAVFWMVRTDGFEFLRVDDGDWIVENEHVRGGLSADGVVWAFASCEAGSNWHPVTWVSLMADASIAGGGSTQRLSSVMHRHNALVQGASAALLFLVMLTLVGGAVDPRRVLVAALLSLAWGLHPLRAECVCWAIERKELLCTAFSLLAILLWKVRFRAHRLASFGAFALAILSKSVAVTVPCVLVAIDLVGAEDRWKAIRRSLPYYAAQFVLCGIASYCTLVTQAPAVVGNSEGCPLMVRLACAVSAYAGHLFAFLVPVDLYFFHQFADTFSWGRLLPGIVLCGLMLYSACAFLIRGGFKAGFLAAAWIGAGLLPMCGVVRVGIEMDPDRYGNWIGCGFAVVLFSLCSRLLQARVARAAPMSFLLGLVACSYAASAWHYAGFWRNTFTIFQRTLSVVPGHPEALVRIGVEYAETYDRPDLAIEFFERSLRSRPSDEVASQLAIMLSSRATKADLERIKALCANVMRDHSLDKRGAALMALGIAFMREQNWSEAISCLQDAVARQRGDKKLKGNTRPIEDNQMRIAMCYYNMGDYGNARPWLVPLASSSYPDIREKARQLLGFIWQKEHVGPRNSDL